MKVESKCNCNFNFKIQNITHSFNRIYYRRQASYVFHRR